MRFRPSHFPFTEPSAEVDIGYELKDGKIIGEGDKWLEILGWEWCILMFSEM